MKFITKELNGALVEISNLKEQNNPIHLKGMLYNATVQSKDLGKILGDAWVLDVKGKLSNLSVNASKKDIGLITIKSYFDFRAPNFLMIEEISHPVGWKWDGNGDQIN